MGKMRWILPVLATVAVIWGLCSGNSESGGAVASFSEPETTVAVMATQAQAVEFPCVLREPELIVQHLAQYEGDYLEDDRQEQVAGVAALMIYNPGSGALREATVQLQQTGEILTFEISYLPAGSRVLVLEKDGKLYTGLPVEACRCISFSREEFDRMEEQISLAEENGQLVVENISGKVLMDVTIYYKQYASEGKFYLGGAACEKNLGTLQPGQRLTVLPYHYAPGYSQVLAVTADG